MEWLSLLVTRFRAANPAVRIEISSDREPNLLSGLVGHDLDAVFFSPYPPSLQTAWDLVIHHVCTFGGDDDLWLALPRVGRSHILSMFEQMVHADSPRTAGTVAKRRACYAPSVLRKRTRMAKPCASTGRERLTTGSDEGRLLLGLSGARGRRSRSGLGEAGDEFIGLLCKKFVYRLHRQK